MILEGDMEAIDVFYGQNWVDQAQHEHTAHPNRGGYRARFVGIPCESILTDTAYPWEIITDSMRWNITTQGWGIWNERHIAFRSQRLGQNRLLR